MSAGTYIGRIGGLAVALGVGTAVLTGLGCGVASADTSETSSHSSESSSTSDSGSHPETSNPTTSDGGTSTTPQAVTSPTAATPTVSKGPKKKTARAEAPVTKRPKTFTTTATKSAVDAEGAPATEATTVASASDPASEANSRPVADAVAIEPAVPAATEHAKGNIVAVVVARVIGTALAPFAAHNTPDTPAESPSLWTLAAFARREFEKGLPDAKPAATSMSVPQLADGTLDNAAATVELSSAVADTQSLYTGQPSLVERVFVVGLRVLNFATKVLHLPFSLSGSPLSVPFFTDGIPPSFLTLGLKVSSAEVNGEKVWTLQPADPTGKYVIALHGGSYVGQVNIFQWWTYADMARSTGATVVVPLYDLAPKGTAATVVPQTADFISSQIEQHGAENVSVLGDSAGGGIALSAVQLMVQRGDTVPGHMVLLSPVLDVTVSNPAISSINDPLLDPDTSRANGLLFAGDLDPKDPLVSPLYGSLEGLPPTTIYSGSLDIRSPDALVLRQKAIDAGAPITFELRNGQIHDWVIFPFLPDARAEWPGVYAGLGADPAVQG